MPFYLEIGLFKAFPLWFHLSKNDFAGQKFKKFEEIILKEYRIPKPILFSNSLVPHFTRSFFFYFVGITPGSRYPTDLDKVHSGEPIFCCQHQIGPFGSSVKLFYRTDIFTFYGVYRYYWWNGLDIPIKSYRKPVIKWYRENPDWSGLISKLKNTSNHF